jgi:uncharacterized protein (DUF1330 family)
MVAYFVVQGTIKDEAQFQRYREAVVPFIASFGGRLIARGAKVEVLEGEHDTRPVVMFEFPSMEAIHAFWNSPDYAPIKKLREGIATISVLGGIMDLWVRVFRSRRRASSGQAMSITFIVGSP